MRRLDTDVVVIGTGFGAAASALRLAHAGFRVVMIEKGPHLHKFDDFRQTQDPKYFLRFIKSMGGDHLNLTYAEALGGGSAFTEMVMLRAPSVAFEQVDQSGERLWPAGLDRTSLDPYYDRAETMMSVEQIRDTEVPKNGLLFAAMMKNLGYSCERARYAVKNCVGCGFCVSGCVFGAKQSLLWNYLPQAVEAGAWIETGLEAVEILPTSAGQHIPVSAPLETAPHRYDVICERMSDRLRIKLRARILILGGGTVGTAKLLLRSQPNLPRLSDQVGRNIAFNGSVKAACILGDHFPHGDMFAGRSHPGTMSFEFLRSHGVSISAGKPMPLQLMVSARLRLEGDLREPSFWGKPHADLMRLYRHRMMVLVAFGMTPPLGRIRRNGESFDLRMPVTGELQHYHRETKALLHSIMRRNECHIIEADFVNHEGRPHSGIHISSAHQVGSCRMAETRSRGVVGPNGEVFGYPGMYVVDGAAVPTSLAVNTALTITANAERIAEGIIHAHRPAPPVTVMAESGSSDVQDR